VPVPHLLAQVATHHSAGDGDAGLIPVDILLILVGVVIGRFWGRRTGIKHLGEAEFKSRWSTVRKHKKW
jgi:hypothetical protein